MPRLVATAAAALALSGMGLAAPPANRQEHQENRIAEGLTSGRLTAADAHALERRQNRISRSKRLMRYRAGGHLTARQHAALAAEQNRAGHAITRDERDHP